MVLNIINNNYIIPQKVFLASLALWPLYSVFFTLLTQLASVIVRPNFIGNIGNLMSYVLYILYINNVRNIKITLWLQMQHYMKSTGLFISTSCYTACKICNQSKIYLMSLCVCLSCSVISDSMQSHGL